MTATLDSHTPTVTDGSRRQLDPKFVTAQRLVAGIVSAIMMLVVWRLSPLENPWLGAKIIALLVYIGLGMVALRFGRTRRVRVGAWLLALITAGYIVSVAYSKNPLGFLQFIV